jgi:hypothetical protein
MATGLGDLLDERRAVARSFHGSFKLSSDAFPRKTLCVAKNASKLSWQGWDSRFQNRGKVYARTETGDRAPVEESSGVSGSDEVLRRDNLPHCRIMTVEDSCLSHDYYEE